VSSCGACGEAVGPDERFCGECGAAVTVRCAACDSPLAPGKKFCTSCGAPVAGAPVATRPPPEIAVAGELRVVSVIFCDLVGFTSRSEDLEPDIVRELLSGYFDDARAIISRHGGTIEKFIGDAVMAVWGVPIALENDAERSVRASLELVDAVHAFGEEHHLEGLAARVGVVTGQAAAMDSVEEGIVVGDRVNTAARIQALAEPGAVYVDDTTRAATAAAIAFRDAGEHTVKGKTEPVRVWRAERAIAGALGAHRTNVLEADLIGRDHELRLVKDQFHSAVDRGIARLVSIVGPAGVGKSRLAWEFYKYVDGVAFVVNWHRGECLSYGDGVAYWALAQMVRQRFGIGEQDPAEVVRTKLESGIRERIEKEADQAFIEPRLAQLLGASDGDLARDDLFAGWRMLFERLADRDPVALVIDDLQWADAGLLDFLDSLLDWSASHPIFILTMARPELGDRRPGWGQRRNGTSVGLDPLDDAAMLRLLDDLIDLPPTVAEHVVGQAEGIPLYAVEIVRSLIDRGLVDVSENQPRLVAEVDELEVPASLTALLVARLDGLPPAERALVRDLAVLGTSFPREAIDAVAQPADVPLDDLLGNLVRREVLTVLADPLSPERGQLQFAQTLMRTVVYDNLTKRERKHRHIAVAQHLESVFPDEGAEIAEVIADHLHQAHDADRAADDAPDLRARAADAYQRAAARASSIGAPATALTAYKQALELVDDPGIQAELRHRAGAEARLSGLHDDAIALLEQARADLAALERIGESRATVSELSLALSQAGRIDEAAELLRRAVEAIEPDASDRGSVLLMSRAASFRILGGEPTDDGLNARVISYAEAADDVPLLVRALSMEGARQNWLDNPVYAGILHAGAVDLARQQDDPALLAQALTNYGQALSGGDIKAMDVLEEDFANARRLGRVSNSVVALSNLGRTMLRWGDWDDLVKTIEPEIDTLREHSVVGSSEPIHHLAVVAAWRGAHDEAAQRWELAVPLCTDDAQDRLAIQTYRTLIDLAADPRSVPVKEIEAILAEAVATFGWRSDNPPFLWSAGIDAAFAGEDLSAAERMIEQLGALGPGQRPPYLSAELLRARARLALAQERDDEDVEAFLRQALAGFEAIGMPVPTAHARFDLRDWLLAHGREAEAAELAGPAVTTAEHLGAVSLLDRL
jgi:class 3 adenylate cyclase/tetratricopeptide (TPR) repeat protein